MEAALLACVTAAGQRKPPASHYNLRVFNYAHLHIANIIIVSVVINRRAEDEGESRGLISPGGGGARWKVSGGGGHHRETPSIL